MIVDMAIFCPLAPNNGSPVRAGSRSELEVRDTAVLPGLPSNGTYTGDPPSGLMARGAFLGFQSLDRKVCGDVDAVVPVPASC
jgi:hypothetical protein